MPFAPPKITWPDGRRFAFSVFDDTDRASLENVPRVYEYLRDLGFRTTKSVWPLAGEREPDVVGGETCANPEYAAWVQQLQRDGFEIGLHNVTFHSSKRDATLRGFARFQELFSHYPRALANHTTCAEGMYWGPYRVSGVRRIAYNVMTRFRQHGRFHGHDPSSEYFWGDLCREHVDYVRNFTLPGLDTLAACPFMPYFDPDRPWVKAWFASSEGDKCSQWVETLTERAQDQLEESGGACIMYTHFGKGFYQQGELNQRFTELMNRLARKNGWFVPVSRLLDHIAQARGGIHPITRSERAWLENRWLLHKAIGRAP